MSDVSANSIEERIRNIVADIIEVELEEVTLEKFLD